MELKCKQCNKIFTLSYYTELKYIKNPNKNYFCSKSCAAKYNQTHLKQLKNISKRDDLNSIPTEYICENCNKQFQLSKYQQTRLVKEKDPKLFCSKSCSVSYSNKNRSNDWKQIRKETLSKKYGDSNYVNKEKISNTVKKLYKTKADYGFRSCNYKQTMLNKYGAKNIAQTEYIKQHNLEKYGTEYYFQSKDYKQKTGKTNISKYGCLYHMQNKEQIEKYRQTIRDRYNVEWITDVPEVREKIKQGLYKTYNDNNNSNQTRYVSKINKQVGKIFEDNNINIQNYEYFLEGKWYDMKTNQTLIEINPSITHNILYNPFGQCRDKNYHRMKTELAIKNNFKCIHIFDWDNIDKIVNMLQQKQTLYARNLQVINLDSLQCNDFLHTYHLQNTCKGQTIRLALVKDSQIIQVMTFGKPRYNNNYEYELLRLCTHKDYKVVGGSEKLFSYFVTNYRPKSIISYCDMSKFSGSVYERLGFTLKTKGKCNLHWFNLKTKRHITNNLLLQRGFSQLHSDNYEKYNKGEDNEKLMLDNGYLPIYDCGQNTYVWKEK